MPCFWEDFTDFKDENLIRKRSKHQSQKQLTTFQNLSKSSNGRGMGGGGGRGGCHPQRVFPAFSLSGENFYSKLIFSCRNILWASVREKIFWIGPTSSKIRQREGAERGAWTEN